MEPESKSDEDVGWREMAWQQLPGHTDSCLVCCSTLAVKWFRSQVLFQRNWRLPENSLPSTSTQKASCQVQSRINKSTYLSNYKRTVFHHITIISEVQHEADFGEPRWVSLERSRLNYWNSLLDALAPMSAAALLYNIVYICIWLVIAF